MRSLFFVSISAFALVGDAQPSPASCNSSGRLDDQLGIWAAQPASANVYPLNGDPLDLLPPAGSIRAGSVIVQIGSHTESSYFKRLLKDPEVFLIGVEPNPVAGRQHPKHRRFALLPVAISGSSAYHPGRALPLMPLHLTDYDECSSLLRPIRDSRDILSRCTTEVDVVHVPVMPLAPILERALSYGPVVILQVDAQGADIEVVESGRSALGGVNRVVLELQDHSSGTVRPLYESQPSKEEVVARMKTLGFERERCWPNGPKGLFIREENCAFVRPGLRINVQEGCFTVDFAFAVNSQFHGLCTQRGDEVCDFVDTSIADITRMCCSNDWRAGAMGCWNSEIGYTPERCCVRRYFDAAGLIEAEEGYDEGLAA